MSEPNTEVPDPADPGAFPDRLVKIARYGKPGIAEIHAMALEAEGIHAEVFGANATIADWFWQNFNDVELFVPERDAERAAAIIARTSDTDLEPVDEPADAAQPTDERGRTLVPVAAFDSIAGLRNAEAVLGSKRIDAFPPHLRPRGDQPAGQGDRFILRVAGEDLERAQLLLQEEVADDRDEPRCPKCGSWSVYTFPNYWKNLAAVAGLSPKPEAQIECLHCHYRGAKAEFIPGTGLQPPEQPISPNQPSSPA